jgi:hypothetical protein
VKTKHFGWILLVVCLSSASGAVQGEIERENVSPTMTRIEWIRKQLSWLLGQPYIPSKSIAALRSDPGSSLAEESSGKVHLKKKESGKTLNLWAKRRFYRWRCKTCRIYTKESCPRCHLDLKPRSQ